MLILLNQTNKKIEHLTDRMPIPDDDEQVLIFGKERPEDKLNSYHYKKYKEIRDDLCNLVYRGTTSKPDPHIKGQRITIHVYTKNFNFPIYHTKVTYIKKEVINNMTKQSYVTYNCAISFKLKDREDRLGFDVNVRTFDSIDTIVSSDYITSQNLKAVKLDIQRI